jgi:hypothetical protein
MKVYEEEGEWIFCFHSPLLTFQVIFNAKTRHLPLMLDKQYCVETGEDDHMSGWYTRAICIHTNIIIFFVQRASQNGNQFEQFYSN